MVLTFNDLHEHGHVPNLFQVNGPVLQYFGQTVHQLQRIPISRKSNTSVGGVMIGWMHRVVLNIAANIHSNGVFIYVPGWNRAR